MKTRWMKRKEDGVEEKFYPITHIDAVINGVSKDKFDALEEEVEATKKSVSDGKTLVANAITEKGVATNTDDTFSTMANNIESIVTLENGTSDATATAADILSGKTAYVNGEMLTGIMSAGSKVASGTHTFTGAYKYSLSTTINVGFKASKYTLKFNNKFPNYIYNSEVTGIPIDTVYTNMIGSWNSYGRTISGSSISASLGVSTTDTGIVLTFYAYTSEALWGNGSVSISWFAVE